ncbi:serine/threonine-protein kinase [Streptomyces sp. HB132]|uniref:serine/threonine-protein kinase n=1 Tax=Streptomyces sp. HB132 TaxID=767388 RepID=UPI001961588A|nr:PQQ-binding-like beta-propeller repeat protein [Streptomyces sp. HB132]MBM7437772.1 outer membrane protein assembly factor BamB [Streptomyces sp. HB132]
MQPLGFGDPIRLGPYRIAGVLGEGGMGKVYVGHDSSGRLAAVKVLRPELAHDRDLARRFLREAQTAQAVTSSGVARVVGSQTEGGRPWIATEYLSGPTLEQAITEHGPLDDAGVRALAGALASTLREIHAVGLVHRDLKPANIVLTSSGPRIIDFGIARPEHGLTLTTTGQAPATPGYGAPEQILGQRVGPSADVFSLGAVLVYAASGRQAYGGTHVAAVQYEVVHGSPALQDVPQALRPLIAPCLAKEAAHRPHPSAVIQAFAAPRGANRLWRSGVVGRQIKEYETRAQRFTTLPNTVVPEARPSRRRLLASFAAGGAVLAVGGGATAWWLNRGPGLPEAADAAPAKLLTPDEYERGAPPTPLWGPLKAAAPSASVLLPVRDVVMVAGLSGGLTAHRVTDGRQKWKLPQVSPSAGFLRLTAGEFVAADADGNVLAFDASTGEQKWSVPASARRLLATAPDAELVYVLTKDDEVAAVGTEDREVRWTAGAPAGVVVDPASVAAAAPGRLVVCTADGSYFALDSANGEAAWQLGGHAGTALTPAVEGRFVYVGGKSLLALDLETGDEVWSASSQSLNPDQDGWGSPVTTDDHIAAIDDGRLYRVDKASGTDSGLISWPDGTVPSRTPPVVQGHTLWIVEGGTSSGVSAFGNNPGSESDGDLMWTYEPDSEGPWHAAGAGNRVFLLNRGSLVALPVF